MKKETIKNIKHFLDINLDNFIASHIFKNEKNIDDLLKSLQNKFQLKNYPYKIVCLDISHTSGKNPSGGLSAMIGGIISKKDFRQFKIPDELGGNDYESLKYCIIKYFKNNTADLFILDGGKGQLNIIDDLPNDIVLKTDFMSIGKGKARKRAGKITGNTEIFFKKDKEIPVNYDSIEDKLLLKLRDYAHNLSNKYRKKQENIKLKNLF